jgi:hypothetical protein
MRCQDCRHEWTPPTDRCPRCGAEVRVATPSPRAIDTRPLNEKAFLSVMLVFLTLIEIQFTVYGVLLPLLSLPLAVSGLIEIKRSKGRVAGTGHAVLAIVISLYFLLAGLPGLFLALR